MRFHSTYTVTCPAVCGTACTPWCRRGDVLHRRSFLNLGEFSEREVEPLARALRERVHRWVGIPTCVGIGPTKTLAKVANFIAKKRPGYGGVCDLRSSQVRAELLPTVPVEEVWGIGGASAAKLAKLGIQTAADLAALGPDDACALTTATGGRTVYELRGISCLSWKCWNRRGRDRCHPELWKTGYELAGNARSAGQLRNPRSGEDAPV